MNLRRRVSEFIRQLPAFIRWHYDTAAEAAWNEKRYGGRPMPAWRSLMIDVFTYVRCTVHDHDFEDNSYGGPESGYIGVQCTRCGYSSGQQLY